MSTHTPQNLRLLGLHPQDAVILSREAARQVDRCATTDFLIPSIVLMENAAIHLATAIRHEVQTRPILILAGAGNNGGDGFAAARHLFIAHTPVRIITPLGPPKPGSDAAVNAAIAQRIGIPIHNPDPDKPLADVVAREAAHFSTRGVILDALFGTGLDRPIHGRAAEAIHAISQMRRLDWIVIAADIPSGLDADTGQPLGTSITADATVTFAGLKPGLLHAHVHTGRLWLAGIGIPPTLLHALGQPLPPHLHVQQV